MNMNAEYKRDSNHNYLIFHEESYVSEDSYQLRMLTGNTMTQVLPCHVRKIDGKLQLCYDITSRQNMLSLYEGKKLGKEELVTVFEGCLAILEEMEEYLLGQDQLLLDPEFIYLDPEKKKLYFCCLPGYDRESGQQFRELMEYLLPKIEHKDQAAVELGYGIYRKALDETIPTEEIRLLLSRTRNGGKEEPSTEDEGRKGILPGEQRSERKGGDLWEEEPSFREGEEAFRGEGREYPDRERTEKKRKGRLKAGAWLSFPRRRLDLGRWKSRLLEILFVTGFLLLLFGYMALRRMGYFMEISLEVFLGSLIVVLAAGLLGSRIYRAGKEKTSSEREDQEALTELSSFAGYEEKTLMEKPPYPGKAGWEKREEEKSGAGSGDEISAGQEDAYEEEYGETVMLYKELKGKNPCLVNAEGTQKFAVDKEINVIGKLKDTVDIALMDPSVSRIHARIRKKEEEYYLSDLNSRNGTFLNGELLEAGKEVLLQDGDQICLAKEVFLFVREGT